MLVLMTPIVAIPLIMILGERSPHRRFDFPRLELTIWLWAHPPGRHTEVDGQNVCRCASSFFALVVVVAQR